PRDVEKGCCQAGSLDEQESYEKPTNSPVAVEEWMYRLKLVVHEGALDQNRHLGWLIHETLPIREEIWDLPRKWRYVGCRIGAVCGRAYPDRALPELAR